MRTVLPISTLLLAAACASPEVERLRDALPDERLVLDDAALHNELARGVGGTSEYYEETMGAIADTNAGIVDILAGLDEITAFRPTYTSEDDTALWGPWLDDGLWGKLWIRGEVDGTFNWALQIRPDGSAEDAWVDALRGHVEAGSDPLVSHGRIQIDFTAIDGAGAGDGETGRVALRYDLRPDGAEVTLAAGEFSEDGSVPADGRVHYDYDLDGGLLDFVGRGDLSENPDGSTIEDVRVRSRWNAEGAGRADALVTGGELGVLEYTESECWDSAHTVVFWESVAELERQGDEKACAFETASFAE